MVLSSRTDIEMYRYLLWSLSSEEDELLLHYELSLVICVPCTSLQPKGHREFSPSLRSNSRSMGGVQTPIIVILIMKRGKKKVN